MPAKQKDALPKARLAKAGEGLQASTGEHAACWATAANVSHVHDNEDRALTGWGRVWLQDGLEVCYQIAAVVDGHGGAGASEHVAQHCVSVLSGHLEDMFGDVCAALFATCADLEEQCLALTPPTGACMCLCVAERSRAWVANLGDCRALAVSLEDGPWQLSLDQRTGHGAEYHRILKAGGSVVGNAVEGLMPSRTLGDPDVKSICPPGVILAEPELRVWEGSGLVIIASDGLWDVLSNNDVIGLLPNGKSLRRACQEPGTLQALADLLVAEAMRRGAQDDVTALLLPVL